MLSGTVSSLGNYDQCLGNIDILGSGTKENEIAFGGRYCLLEIKPPPLPQEKHLTTQIRKEKYANFSKSVSGLIRVMLPMSDLMHIEGARLAVCVPSGCTENDIQQVAIFASQQLTLSATMRECQTREAMKYDATIGSIIFFLALLEGLAVVGTCLEIYSEKNKMSFENKFLRISQAFSIRTNFKDLSNCKDSKKVIACLHGIRFLTVVWIILMHTYLFAYQNLYVHGNAVYFFESMHQFLAQIFFNGTLSVETFFLLGGFLHCYSRASESDEKREESNILIRLRHRIFRIFPAYASAILLNILLFSLISGPRLQFSKELKENCLKHWWRNLLFIHNFQKMDEICLGHTWYLGADMQYFVVALFTIPVLLRWPKVGIALNASIVLSSMLYSAVFAWVKKFPATFIFGYPSDFMLYMEEYCRPFSHAGSYFLGILLADFLKKRDGLKLSAGTQVLCWISSIILSSASLFGIKEWNSRGSSGPTLAENVLYAGFSNICFALGVAWIVMCCSTGKGGIVNSFLSWKGWIPFSRLTFTIFLVAPLVQFSNIATLRTVEPFSHILLVRRFIADFVISCFVAMGLFLLVENPLTSVERIIFSKSECKKKPEPETVMTVSVNTYT